MSEDGGGGRHQLALDFIDDLDAETRAVHAGWENARDREKASRSRFAQHALKPEEVAAELEHVLPVDVLGAYVLLPVLPPARP